MKPNYDAIADELASFARSEAETLPTRMAVALQHPRWHTKIVPCAGKCGVDVIGGGLCPGCLELAAGACRWKARRG